MSEFVKPGHGARRRKGKRGPRGAADGRDSKRRRRAQEFAQACAKLAEPGPMERAAEKFPMLRPGVRTPKPSADKRAAAAEPPSKEAEKDVEDANTRKKKVVKPSDRVLGMKFMMRRAERQKKAADDARRAKQLRDAQWVSAQAQAKENGGASDDDEDAIICIPDDSVGNEIEQDLHMKLTGGRKSFGRMNERIENPERLRAVSFDTTPGSGTAARRGGGIDDEEMTSRFEKYTGLQRGRKGKGGQKGKKQTAKEQQRGKWNGRARRDQKKKGERGHTVYVGLRNVGKRGW
jgi:hypothetical protein